MVLGRAWDFTQSGERSPNRVWSRRVECRFTDTDTEAQKAGWFPWGYRLGSVQQGSGIWIYISVFPSDGRLHRLSSVLGVFRHPCWCRMDWHLLMAQPCSQGLFPRPTCPSLQLPDHLSSSSCDQGQPFSFHPLPWAKPALSSTQFQM